MSNEIKVTESEIRQHLSNMKNTIDSLQPVTPREDSATNQLEVVDQLNQMNRRLEHVLTLYKQILYQNEESTRNSMDTMVEVDHSLSQYRIR